MKPPSSTPPRAALPGQLSPTEAVALQKELRALVVPEGLDGDPDLVCGVDLSIRGERAAAALVVVRFPGMEPVEEATAVARVAFPYIPGLLAFREIPSILDAFEKLEARPDLLLVDGQGLAHPRRFGIACHLGVLLDLPSVGCGKSRLVGEHREPGPRRGSKTQLRDRGELIGAVLRTRDDVRPVHVSIGHRIDLGNACRILLRCCKGYRLPEPIRRAHRLAGAT